MYLIRSFSLQSLKIALQTPDGFRLYLKPNSWTDPAEVCPKDLKASPEDKVYFAGETFGDIFDVENTTNIRGSVQAAIHYPKFIVP